MIPALEAEVIGTTPTGLPRIRITLRPDMVANLADGGSVRLCAIQDVTPAGARNRELKAFATVEIDVKEPS